MLKKLAQEGGDIRSQVKGSSSQQQTDVVVGGVARESSSKVKLDRLTTPRGSDLISRHNDDLIANLMQEIAVAEKATSRIEGRNDSSAK